MQTFICFSIIFFSLGVFGLIVIIIFLFMNQSKDNLKTNTGIFLVDIDLKKNRLKKSDLITVIDKDINRNSNIEFFNEGWMDIDDFLSNLSKENKEIFLNGLDAIKTNRKYVKFIIKNETLRESGYQVQWLVEFFQTKNDMNATIKWSYGKKMPIGLRIISKEELFKDNHQYKSFIAFNLRDRNHKTFQEFIRILFKSLKMKNLDFFVSKNIVILIVYGQKNEEIEIQLKLILKKYEEIKSTKNISSYCDAVAVVESKNLVNSKDLLKIINRIYFSLIKSTQLNKIFYFNAKNIFFNEYEEFKDNYTILNNIIKNNKISSIKIPILDAKNNSTIATYLKPNFEYPVNFWTDIIVDNKNILPNIQNEYFNHMLKTFKNLDQYLIDVNDYIILQNIDKLKELPSMIFIIKFIESTNIQNLELIASTLKQSGIKFGIRVEHIIPETITLIESIMPHAIIISENLIDTEDLRKFLNLKQLITLCSKNPATLIFENPTPSNLSDNIINYYYNSQIKPIN